MFSVEQVVIRRMIEADVPTVKRLKDKIFNVEQEESGDSLYTISDKIPTVLAEWQGCLVGIAAVYRNSLHPYIAEVMVGVDQPYRRQGLGRKLYDAALRARPLQEKDIGFQGDYCKGNDATEAFLAAMGYQQVLDCHVLDLDIEYFDDANAALLPPKLEMGGLTVVSFAELFTVSSMKKQLFDFLVMRYTEEHFWSPPQPKEHPEWEKIVFKGISPDISLALLASNQVIGAVSAGITDNILDMIWGYISRQYADSAALLLKYLLISQFKTAQNRGIYKASVEVDTTDVVYSSLLTWLPIINDKIWRICQRKKHICSDSGAE